MMLPANARRGLVIDQVRHYYALVDRGDVSGVIALFAERAVYERPGYEPIIGHDQLDDFYYNRRVIKHGRHEVTRIVSDIDSAAVEGVFVGTLKDGREVELGFADFFTINDELLISARRTYFYSPLV